MNPFAPPIRYTEYQLLFNVFNVPINVPLNNGEEDGLEAAENHRLAQYIDDRVGRQTETEFTTEYQQFTEQLSERATQANQDAPHPEASTAPGSPIYSDSFNNLLRDQIRGIRRARRNPQGDPNAVYTHMAMDSALDSVDQHFNQSQSWRDEADRNRAMALRREEYDEAWNRIEENNSGRRPENKFDTLCDFCLTGLREAQEDSYFMIGSEHVCKSCASRFMARCQMCQVVKGKPEILEASGNHFCKPCVESHMGTEFVECSAEGCGKLLFGNWVQQDTKNFCNECFDELIANHKDDYMDDDTFPRRSYSRRKSKDFCSDKSGNIIKSKRHFAAEIECIAPDAMKLQKVAAVMPRALGIDSDGSIEESDGLGVEFQTPKLQGDKGEKFILEFLNLLQKKEFTTNKTCGLHIHIDGAGDFMPTDRRHTSRCDGSNIRNLFLFYFAFEDTIQSFLPRSRRANRFCKLLKSSYHFDEISTVLSVHDFERIWYRAQNRTIISDMKSQHKHHTRYAGVNFHTLLSENHLEVRFHSGTLNARKVLEWVALHTRIMDCIAQESVPLETIKSIQEITDLDEKTETFFNLINLPEASQSYFLRRQLKFKERSKIEEDAMVLR